jgi:hypothetical protein
VVGRRDRRTARKLPLAGSRVKDDTNQDDTGGQVRTTALGASYPVYPYLIAPAINPAVSRFRTSKNSSTVGTVATLAVAIK